MFVHYFGFKQNPFELNNEPSFFFMDATRKTTYADILRDLEYGYNPIVLMGDQGSGKTQLLQQVLKSLPSDMHSMNLINSCMSYKDSVKITLDMMAGTDQHQNQKLLIIVDNAHEISNIELASILLLHDYFIEEVHSFQLVLSGSKELETKLIGINEKKFQGYPCHYPLTVLNQEEVKQYINFCLCQTGYKDGLQGELFSDTAIELIAKISNGLHYSINLLCSAALMIASMDRQRKVTEQQVSEAFKLCIDSPHLSSKAAFNQSLYTPNDEVTDLQLKTDFSALFRKLRDFIRFKWLKLQWQKLLKNKSGAPAKRPIFEPLSALLWDKRLFFYASQVVVIIFCLLGLTRFWFGDEAVSHSWQGTNETTAIQTIPEAVSGDSNNAIVAAALTESSLHQTNPSDSLASLSATIAAKVKQTETLSDHSQDMENSTLNQTNQVIVSDESKQIETIKIGESLPVGTNEQNSYPQSGNLKEQEKAIHLSTRELPLQKDSKLEQRDSFQVNSLKEQGSVNDTDYNQTTDTYYKPTIDNQATRQNLPAKQAIEQKASSTNLAKTLKHPEAKKHKRNSMHHSEKLLGSTMHNSPHFHPQIDPQEAAARDRAARRLHSERLSVKNMVSVVKLS